MQIDRKLSSRGKIVFCQFSEFGLFKMWPDEFQSRYEEGWCCTKDPHFGVSKLLLVLIQICSGSKEG